MLLDHPWRYGVLLGGILYFGSYLLKALPLIKDLATAVISGAVKWPGPIAHDPNPKVNMGRRLFGLPMEHLLPEFVFYTLGLLSAFTFSLLTFLSGTSLMSGQVFINWTLEIYFITLVVFIGGGYSINKLGYFVVLVERLLSNLSSTEEPRQVDGLSAEAEYAIEHPLLNAHLKGASNQRALELFTEATTYIQHGERQKAYRMFQEALKVDPELHHHAKKDLIELLQKSSQSNLLLAWNPFRISHGEGFGKGMV